MMDQRRGKIVALVGLAFQAAFALVTVIVWLWTRSQASMASLWIVAAGGPLWIVVALLFYCRQLERREDWELQEIARRGGGAGALFERKQELDLRPAARRLAWTERYVAPAFTLLWAAGQVASGVLMLRYLSARPGQVLVDPGQGSVFFMLIGFLAFLFSYYCLGLADRPAWRPLRAAGSYLLVTTLFLAGSAASLIASWQGYAQVDRAVAWVAPLAQIVLSVELLLNFLLDLYRPRIPGQEQRFSFDSRLLNLLAEPGKVGHSIAETINYQFGFEVSKTWFYKLVSRAMTPLLVVAGLILLGMSSLVIVRQGQVAIVRHWGRLPAGQATRGPGLHLKWPWPIDSVERYDTSAVHEVILGTGEERSAAEIQGDYVGGMQVFLWTKAHGPWKELDFLLAAPPWQGIGQQEGQKPPPPVWIIKLVVSMQYVIDDAYRFAYGFRQPQKVLECLAYREMTRYFASATLDTPLAEANSDRPQAIMTTGRDQAARRLQQRVQDSADRLGLGVRIIYVGFLGIHPPKEAAPAFEEVLQAERQQEETRFQAEANAFASLTRYGGSPFAALQTALSIQRLNELEELQRLQGTQAFGPRLEEYIRSAEGSLKELQQEVEQERRMGKLSAQRQTDREKLRDDYEGYLGLLGTIRSAAQDPNRPGLGLAMDVQRARQVLEDPNSRALASGEPAALIAHAYADRWQAEMSKRAQWEALHNHLLAYQASPQVYLWDRWMTVWNQALPQMHKYVLAVDPNRLEPWLDVHRESSPLEGAEFTGPQKQPRKPD